MNRRFLLLITLGFVVGLAMLLRPKLNYEPYFAGQPMKYWFNQCCRFTPEVHPNAAEDIMREFGTNAVLFLLKENSRTSWMKTRLTKARYEISRFLGWRWLCPVEPERTALEAMDILRTIKPPGKLLLQLLEVDLKKPESPDWLHALYLLGFSGDLGGNEEVALILARGLKSTNYWANVMAAQSLRDLGFRARPALPAMIQALKQAKLPSNDPRLIIAIGNCGPDAKAAIPWLEAELASIDPRMCLIAAVALCQINPDHPIARPLVARTLKSKDNRQDRSDVFFALNFARTGTGLFVPMLRQVAIAKTPFGNLPRLRHKCMKSWRC